MSQKIGLILNGTVPHFNDRKVREINCFKDLKKSIEPVTNFRCVVDCDIRISRLLIKLWYFERE